MALREVLAEFGIKFDDAAVAGAERKVAGLTGSLERVGKSVLKADRSAHKFGGSTQRLGELQVAASLAARKLALAEQDLQRELRKVDDGSGKVARKQQRLAQAAMTAKRGVDRAERALKDYHRQSTKIAANAAVQRSMKAMGTLADKGASSLKRMAVAAGAVAAATAAMAAKEIFQVGSGFEQAITNVAAVGLQTRQQIASLEAEAKRLGATTKFTATEAADAMEIMARAGFKNEEILAGVGGVLDAAAASGLEMAEVSNHVSNVLKGMGLEATDATRVADVLALASARTNSSIGSLGESMKNVASTARQFKIPLEDVVAGVALLQDVGLDASVAGSAMNTMLTKMAAPTSAIKAQMKELGVTFEDAHGNMLPLSEVLKQLAAGTSKTGGNMKQVAFLAELVGLRGQKAAANLANLFESGKFNTLVKELEDAEGSAKKMADIKMDTLQGDITLLGSAIDAVKVSLFETQSGPLRELVQDMTKWVSENEALIKSKFVGWINTIKDNFEGIVFWLKAIGVGLGVWYTYSVVVAVATAVTKTYRGILVATTAAKWLYARATGGATGAIIAETAATRAQTVATVASTGALGRAKTMLHSLGGQAAAATFFVSSLALAWDQLSKLIDESGGWEGFKAGVSSFFSGEGYFKGANEEMDRQAREKARLRNQGTPAVATATASRQENNYNAEDNRRNTFNITVPEGTPREVAEEILRRTAGGLNQPSTAGLRGAVVPLAR
jgi:TP901 family phage tail tape measure protein